MRTSIYRGLQQGAATRRNRALRAAARHRALLRRGFTGEQGRSYLQWDLSVEGAFLMSAEAANALARELAAQNLTDAIKRARYWHRDWKHYARLNREWRAEMAAIEREYA